MIKYLCSQLIILEVHRSKNLHIKVCGDLNSNKAMFLKLSFYTYIQYLDNLNNGFGPKVYAVHER